MKIYYCDFCQKSQKEVKKMIVADNTAVCDECTSLSMYIIQTEGEWFEFSIKQPKNEDLDYFGNIIVYNEKEETEENLPYTQVIPQINKTYKKWKKTGILNKIPKK